MAFQVGAFCYATVVEAAAPACSDFGVITSLVGGVVQTASCSGVDILTGELLINVLTSTTSNKGVITTTSHIVPQLLSFPSCHQSDYIQYFETIFFGIFSIYIIWLCAQKLFSFLGWSRGVAND